MTAKLAYEVLFSDFEVEHCWWYQSLWKWYVPLKYKLFKWMALENKILTWDNFLRCGTRPNICILCKVEAESVYHLLVHCSFTKLLWQVASRNCNIAPRWSSSSMSLCFKDWIKNVKSWCELPCFICWELWKHRNKILFEDKPKNAVKVGLLALSAYKELFKGGKSKERVVLSLFFNHLWVWPIGMFDGVPLRKIVLDVRQGLFTIWASQSFLSLNFPVVVVQTLGVNC